MGRADLHIAGRQYTGWTDLQVRRSFEEGAARFDLQLTDRWVAAMPPRPIAPFASCALVLDGDLVLTGIVDEVSPSYDATSHSIRVAGRSMPGQMIDCSCVLPSGELRGLTLAAIARRLAEPFGIEVLDLAEANEPFDRVRIEQGETAFETLERLARQRGVFLTDDPLGRLVIRRRSKALQGRIETGLNVLSASAGLNGEGQFSSYVVKGAREGGDGWDGETAARSTGRAVDASVPINRPRIILAESQGSAVSMTERAEHEAALRRARARRWSYTLAGWRREDGQLWVTGEEVVVTDLFMGLEQERLLLVEVTFSINDQGEIAELTLAPPEGYDLIAERATGAVRANAAPTGWDSL